MAGSVGQTVLPGTLNGRGHETTREEEAVTEASPLSLARQR